MVKSKILICVSFILLFVSVVFSAPFSKNIPISIQTTDNSGNIVTGTYLFTVNIATDSSCMNIVYTKTDSLQTDSRGIVTMTLNDVNIPFTQGYYICYYRNGELKHSASLGGVPYSFFSRSVNMSGIVVDSSLNLSTFDLYADQITANRGTMSIDWSYIDGDKPTDLSDLTNDAGYIKDGNTGWDNSYGFITSYADTNCSIDSSCSAITYDSETTNWDKNSADDITLVMLSAYNDTILANSKASPGTCTANHVVQNITTSGVQCVPVSNSDSNNYTSSISVAGTTTKTINLQRWGMTNITAQFTDIDTDTDTNCSSAYSCHSIVYSGNTSWVTNNEQDPKVASLSSGKWCTANIAGTAINCTSDTPSSQNNYTSMIAFTGTTTKTLNLQRFGMPNLTAQFTDIDTNTNCSVDSSCSAITYDSETTGWDKNTADDVTIAMLGAYNDTLLANSKASPGSCPANQIVQNITTSGVQCVPDQTGSSLANYWTSNGTTVALNTTYGATLNISGLIIKKIGSDFYIG